MAAPRRRTPKVVPDAPPGSGWLFDEHTAARSRQDRAPAAKTPGEIILVLDVSLLGVRPRVWRRIEVPDTITFFDLHVALQDVMGWCDGHLHEFEVPDHRSGEPLRIGLPGNDAFDDDMKVEWKVPLRTHLRRVKDAVSYRYDFGDNWEHTIKLVAVKPCEPGLYPRCTGGARACPPEDCGGPWGYAEFLRAIADPAHEEHDSMLEWCGGGFDPATFEPRTVHFTKNPQARLQESMS